MKISKKIIALFIAVMMVISAIPFTVSAANEPYLTFTGTASFSIKTNNNAKNWNGTLEYSTDKNTWTTWDGTQISSDNDVLYLRGTGNTQITGSIDDSRCWVITTEGKVACSGDIRTLLDYTDPEYSSMGAYCFSNLFKNWTSLTAAPELPATILAKYCYAYMFNGCTSLTTAPELWATTLERCCYSCMFYGCANLKTAPELWATSLTEECYSNMFNGCTSLTTAPELPAIDLADYCYNSMFQGCTSLTTPSELPATTLTKGCYRSMFQGCTGIKLSTEQTAEYSTPYSIPKEGTGSVGSNSLSDMFSGTGGTFTTGTPAINKTYYIPAPAPTGVAEVNGVGYETLEEAIEAAQSGDTITVLSDRTMETTDIEIRKNLTIDFGEYTLTASRWPLINYANLTLTGTTGGLVSARGLIDNYGTLTISGGAYNNTAIPNPAIWNNPGGTVVINGGTIDSNNADVYNEAGTLTINGGVLNSASSSKVSSDAYSYAVRNLPGSSCTMNGGTVSGVHGGIAAFGDGESTTTVVINDGTVTTHNSELGNDGYYPLYISGNGTSTTVNGGTFSGPRTAVMLDDDDIGLTENTTLTITGGTFTAPSGVAAVTRGDNDSYPAISGGSFSTIVPVEFCAEGFVPVTEPNEEGKYTVDVAKANNGANLTLLGDIEEAIYLDANAYDLGSDAVVKVTANVNSNISETPDVQTKTYAVSSLTPFVDPKGTYTGTYKFAVKNAPAQITETVTVALYASADAQEPVETIEYSVKEYCDDVIATSNDAKLVALCKSILDYGAAAQKEFNYNTDNMAVNEYYNADAIANLVYSDITDTLNYSSLPFTGIAFECLSTLNFNFYVNKNVNITEARVIGDEDSAIKATLKQSSKSGRLFVNVSGIEAGNLHNSFAVYTSEGIIETNLNTLVKTCLYYGSSVELAKTIYFYSNAANTYFN